MTKEWFVEQIGLLQGRMYRISLSILRNSSDIQDAMQETVMKAWEKRHTLRNEAYFGTWITRIAINTCKQLIRRKRNMVLMDELPETSATSDDITLKILIECLPEKLRTPFVLHYSEGMEIQDVSVCLHLTPSAVRSRIHRAKLILRKELTDHEKNDLGAK